MLAACGCQDPPRLFALPVQGGRASDRAAASCHPRAQARGLRPCRRPSEGISAGLSEACGAELGAGQRSGCGHGSAVEACTRSLPAGAPGATRRMLARFGLPTTAPDGVAAGDLLTLMRRDKKAAGGLTFVLPAPGGGPLERVDDPPAAAVDRALAAIGVAA